MESDNSQPAFPTLEYINGKTDYTRPGMTLRDYMAAQALTGLLGMGVDCSDAMAMMMARSAYRFADAMLKVRADGA